MPNEIPTRAPYEYSAGALLITMIGNVPNIILFVQNYGPQNKYPVSIDIAPKGHLDEGENEETAAKREAKEESGLDIKIEQGFKVLENYEIEGRTKKTVTYFLAYVQKEHVSEIVLSHEHSSYYIVPLTSAVNDPRIRSGKRAVLHKAMEYLLASPKAKTTEQK